MKKLLVSSLVALSALYGVAVAQSTNSSTTAGNTNRSVTAKKRGPVFRATKEQIKQAQALLRGRGFYVGEATGKLSDDTRAGLRRYQEAEGLKVTGTLNRVTLEKLNITLTEKQKSM